METASESMSCDDSVVEGGGNLVITGAGVLPFVPSFDTMLSAPSFDKSVSPSSSLHRSLSAASMDLRCMPVSLKEGDGEISCGDFCGYFYQADDLRL